MPIRSGLSLIIISQHFTSLQSVPGKKVSFATLHSRAGKKDMGGKGKGDGGKGGKGSRGSRNTQEMKQLFAQAKGQAEFDFSWNITPDEFQAIWKLDEGGYTWRDFIGAAGSKARWNRVDVLPDDPFR